MFHLKSYAIGQFSCSPNEQHGTRMSTRARVSAVDVQRAIANRISAGQYAAGSRLPSLRAIASELGANRNTVNKAYQALQQLGLVELPPGRNAFRVASAPPPGSLLENFRSQARETVWRAMADGISASEARGELARIVADVYGESEVRVCFFECNRHDSELLGAELSKLTGAVIEPLLLDELPAGAEQIAERHDLLVTTFHHLAEVTRAFQQYQDKIIGVDTRPSHEVLLQLARLEPARLGLVTTLDNTATMLRHIICSYQPSCIVETAVDDDHDAVRRIAAQDNVLFVTHTCRDHVVALTGREPDVVIDFSIDQQSSLFLGQRIRTLRHRKASGRLEEFPAAAAHS